MGRFDGHVDGMFGGMFDGIIIPPVLGISPHCAAALFQQLRVNDNRIDRTNARALATTTSRCGHAMKPNVPRTSACAGTLVLLRPLAARTIRSESSAAAI